MRLTPEQKDKLFTYLKENPRQARILLDTLFRASASHAGSLRRQIATLFHTDKAGDSSLMTALNNRYEAYKDDSTPFDRRTEFSAPYLELMFKHLESKDWFPTLKEAILEKVVTTDDDNMVLRSELGLTPTDPLVTLAEKCIEAHQGALEESASASIEGMTAEQVVGFREQYGAFNEAMKGSLSSFSEMRLDWQGQESERQRRLKRGPERITSLSGEIARVQADLVAAQGKIEKEQKKINGLPEGSPRRLLPEMRQGFHRDDKQKAETKLAELEKDRADLQSEQTNSSPHSFWARTFVKPFTHTQIEAQVQETFKLYVRFMNEPQNPETLNKLQDNLEQWRNLCRLTGGGEILKAVGNFLACIALTVLTLGAESQRPWVGSFYRAARDAAYGKLPDGLRDIEDVCQEARGQGDNPLIKTQALSNEETVRLRDMDEAHEEGASATPGRP